MIADTLYRVRRISLQLGTHLATSGLDRRFGYPRGSGRSSSCGGERDASPTAVAIASVALFKLALFIVLHPLDRFPVPTYSRQRHFRRDEPRHVLAGGSERRDRYTYRSRALRFADGSVVTLQRNSRMRSEPLSSGVGVKMLSVLRYLGDNLSRIRRIVKTKYSGAGIAGSLATTSVRPSPQSDGTVSALAYRAGIDTEFGYRGVCSVYVRNRGVRAFIDWPR